jgi:hypothetical protein
MASHLSHLNSYIGIYEPLKCGVAIPIAFFDALLPISYSADSAFSVLHLVIATLVTAAYLILSINHSIYWIK